MKLRLSILSIFFLLSSLSQASTMYTLSDIKKVYPIVKIMTKVIPPTYKKMIHEEITETFKELNIDYTGYDRRSFMILVKAMSVKKDFVITIELLIREEVRRVNPNTRTVGVTYINRSSFILTPEDDLEDMFDDSLSILLNEFSHQYKEENKAIVKVNIHGDNFAQEMGYETSYKVAVKKAKKSKKDILLFVVTNHCPWCRKFEQRVLVKKTVNDLVQKNYIPLILNKDKDSFPKEFHNPFSPVIHFVDFKSLKSYETVVGYNNRQEFLHLIKKGK
ncbi:MAG: thioredoxin-related protein [Sulfurimonas sp.]|jgi:thioredoxin-related protein|uniref:thioredoxin family protein n=1 Tax=Sulfurimonas sp. TaxID=2022749 RepID=UPI0039E61293